MTSQEQPNIAESEVVRKKSTPLPRTQIIVLLYLQLAEPITGLVMLPFIVQLIQETGITGGDVTKVGYYAGLIDSLFFAAEAVSILQWCRLSDHIGRRPVLLTGLVGLVLSMLCFGLSHTFMAVVASRAVAGVLNGNSGIMKCMMSEITDETNMARAFSFMPIVWALGSTIAPLLGGWLQHPHENLGGVFRKSIFWKDNPYFLPCVIAASYSASAFVISYFLLKETAPLVINSMSNKRLATNIANKNVICADRSLHNELSPLLPAPRKSASLRTLLTPRVLAVIINYAIFAMNDMALIILMPLFLSTPITHGGLGMEPETVGTCLSLSGVANGVVTLLFFPRLCRRFQEKRILAASASSFLAIFLLFPVMNSLARANGRISLGVWVLLCVQILLKTSTTMGFSTMFMYLTAAPPTRFALGATNGLAQTTASVMRATGPVAATSLFAATMSHQLLGGTLVYIVLFITGGGGVAASFLLPEKPWPRSET